ncbi:type II secretion system F family protein [uncultured Treponema sp.]|uniref:type II secretion system F family protein n=1 Tax=uncultured Treponema sp. TaxID=162155 RepID=UPI0025DEDA73|nr:type II secretion system F family protein [uncultured Treponema sp.]
MRRFIFSKSQRLLDLTSHLSELISSGLSLQNSLEILGKIDFEDEKVSKIAVFLHDSLLLGVKFSFALETSPDLKVPSWYLDFITVAENCGNLGAVLFYLKGLLLHGKECREKVLGALLYPGFVFLLTAFAGFISVVFVLPSFSSIFPNEIIERDEAIASMLRSDFLLGTAFVMLLIFVKKNLAPEPCVNILRTMDFLLANSVPTLAAVSCALAFTGGKKKLSKALVGVKKRLLDGEAVADCFSSCFEDAGFKKEGRLLSVNLALCEETGEKKGFGKTADYLASRKMRREKMILSSVQPILLILSGIYVTLILKTAFLPYITNIGGI